jgi:hypothetical protein
MAALLARLPEAVDNTTPEAAQEWWLPPPPLAE